MIKALRFFPLLLLLVTLGVQARPTPHSAAGTGFNRMQDRPLLFTENRGQVADVTGRLRPDILFTTHSHGAKVFITAGAIYYQFERTIFPDGYEPNERNAKDPAQQEDLLAEIKTQTYRFSLSLEDANPAPKIRREVESSYSENFYLGHCPQGITGVHTYGRVVLEEVYPGIDWVVYSKENNLKYDFIVHPGADPAQIKLRVQDADGGRIMADGGLQIKTALGELKEAAPVSFSGEHDVPTSFKKDAEGLIVFKPAAYNKSEILIIDPSVTWATYYGGSSADYGMDCVADGSGNVYMTGYTQSTTGISTSGGFQTANGGSRDAFLVKFSSSGAPQWATYYGGMGDEYAYKCACDGSGNIYTTGSTNSTSAISTTGAHQTNAGGGIDAFIVKFDAIGVRQWGTYYGGSATDVSNTCATDRSGNVYVAGNTLSGTGISTAGAHQELYAGNQSIGDAFLVKFDANGIRQWGTYYGGTANDYAYGCATDTSGNVYLAGNTNSATGISTSGAHQTTNAGGFDGYLARFNSNGVRQWGTYYGGALNETVNGCTTDAFGNVYLSGGTQSPTGIATSGAHQPLITNGGGDGYLAKFDGSGIRLWATYYGGTGGDAANVCITDGSGNIYLSGTTYSTSGIATADAFQVDNRGGGDAFFVIFNSSGVRQWATYFGGLGGDNITAVTLSGSNIYLAGATVSQGIATTGAYQASYGGNNDAFILRLIPNQLYTDSIAGSASFFCAGDTLYVPFRASGTFNTGNVYTAQLSDASRSFAAPVNIGTLTSTAANGTIRVVLPPGTVVGGAYRIRVVSSNPVVYGRENATNLNVNPAPAAPVISFTGGSLVSSVAGIRWHGPQGFISGATGQSYHPTLPGDYYVVVTNSYGCKSVSNIITISAGMLGVGSTTPQENASIYPNPASRHVVIDLGGATCTSWMSMYNPTGERLLDKVLPPHSVNTIDLSGYTAGIYFIVIRAAGRETLEYKIVVEQ